MSNWTDAVENQGHPVPIVNNPGIPQRRMDKAENRASNTFGICEICVLSRGNGGCRWSRHVLLLVGLSSTIACGFGFIAMRLRVLCAFWFCTSCLPTAGLSTLPKTRACVGQGPQAGTGSGSHDERETGLRLIMVVMTELQQDHLTISQ